MAFSIQETRQVGEALKALAMNFNATMPDMLLKMWLAKLSEFPVPVIMAAINNVLDSYEYKTLPPYAVLRKEILKLMGDAVVEDLATLADAEWQRVVTLVERCGSWREPEINYPTTAYVLRSMGGWSQLCEQLTSDSRQWLRKEFIEIWQRSHGKVPEMGLGALCLEALRQKQALALQGLPVPEEEAEEPAQAIAPAPAEEREAPAADSPVDPTQFCRRKWSDPTPPEVFEFMDTLGPQYDQSAPDWWKQVPGAETECHARLLIAKRRNEAYRALKSRGAA